MKLFSALLACATPLINRLAIGALRTSGRRSERMSHCSQLIPGRQSCMLAERGAGAIQPECHKRFDTITVFVQRILGPDYQTDSLACRQSIEVLVRYGRYVL